VSIGATTRPADQVDLHLYEVEQDRKLSLLTKLLDEDRGSFLVFARTKHGTDRLARKLAGAGVRAARIHGDRTQSQRNQALAGFKDGQYRVLVATDVAARGIHVDGIGHVVNYDLPQAPEDFIHRVGRTGRAGARGTASSFSTRSERGEIRRIESALGVRLKPRTVAVDLVRDTCESAKAIALAAAPPRRRSFGFSDRRRAAAQ
jgi:ATP-dependent RNA helicase RhlE